MRLIARRHVRFASLGVLSLMLILVSGGAVAQGRAGAEPLSGFRQQHRTLHEEFAGSLDELARWCAQNGLSVPAIEIRALAAPPATESLRVEALPAAVQPEIAPTLPDAERHWRSELRRLREDHAAALYRLSRDALHRGHPSYAYQLVREVAYYDPDHLMARKLLGYVRHVQRTPSGTTVLWTTPFVAGKLLHGEEWHAQFGWLPQDHVARYESGERFCNGRWMSAAQEAEIRRDFDHAWEVRTEHYLVKTNHSLERGVEIATKLEEFYGFFHEIFAGYFNTPEQMQKLFAGTRTSRAAAARRQYEVHYYRTREEYVERLVDKIPQIALTNGLYFTSDRVAYFYDDPEAAGDDTLYHEASHQLFYEANPRQRPVGEAAHFWVVEGIACYLESYKKENGHYSLGDPRFIRFYWARRRLLQEKYHIPFAEFAMTGLREFQSGSQDELQKRYSEASGWAHFFMHYDGGRYRDALVRHLDQVYNANPRRPGDVPPLWELTGVGPAELDKQYAEHIQALETAARRAGGP